MAAAACAAEQGARVLLADEGIASGWTDLASEPDQSVACSCTSLGRSIDRERR